MLVSGRVKSSLFKLEWSSCFEVNSLTACHVSWKNLWPLVSRKPLKSLAILRTPKHPCVIQVHSPETIGPGPPWSLGENCSFFGCTLPLFHLHGDKMYQRLICSLASGASNKHRVATPTISHTIHGTGIFPYIYPKNQPNVGKSIIHGRYGFDYSKKNHLDPCFVEHKKQKWLFFFNLEDWFYEMYL